MYLIWTALEVYSICHLPYYHNNHDQIHHYHYHRNHQSFLSSPHDQCYHRTIIIKINMQCVVLLGKRGKTKRVQQACARCRPHDSKDGDVAQLVEHRTGTPPTQIRFPGAARDFSSRVNFQCRLAYGVRTPPCAIVCINISSHLKDP